MGIKTEKISDFGKLCRSYRAKHGMVMKDLSEIAGINQSAITKIEQGKSPISFDYIKKTIKAYDIKDKRQQMDFLLSALNSTERLEIPLDQFGPLRKEWLAALFTLGDVKENRPEGWNELLSWANGFITKLEEIRSDFNKMLDKDIPI
jgi:transcriptional regulator with XRE-family HTH domain